ncbi:MAG: winged helix-turn-helix transcriptional regulator [Nitrosopumilaceae archaeon]|nr:winged helix-turn-helix transcriptional regulator [Nitrosopumilaceae archaeon]
MSDPSDDIDVNILSGEDKLKLIGELMSNALARKIIMLLQDQPTYKNNIAKKLDVTFNQIDHHLKKLEQIGLVKIIYEPITKKGIDHKLYKINGRFLLIDSKNMKEKRSDDNAIRRLFKDSVKFAVIFLAGTIPILIQISTTVGDSHSIDYDGDLIPSNSLFFGAVIIIIGLVIDRIDLFRKKRKKD